jgi:coenzyme A diphosphatase NUDT7
LIPASPLLCFIRAYIRVIQLREAFEEVSLPIEEDNLFHLATLNPYVSGNYLLVFPCIYLWTRSTAPTLTPNPSEVEAIFSVRLRSLLMRPQPTPPTQAQIAHSYEDISWILGTPYRLHMFESIGFPSLLSGLTAEILVDIAMIGFGVDVPGFERRASGQMMVVDMVRAVLDGTATVDTQRSRRRAPRRKVENAEV